MLGPFRMFENRSARKKGAQHHLLNHPILFEFIPDATVAVASGLAGCEKGILLRKALMASEPSRTLVTGKANRAKG